MNHKAVYRTAPATPGLLNILLLKNIAMYNYTPVQGEGAVHMAI